MKVDVLAGASSDLRTLTTEDATGPYPQATDLRSLRSREGRRQWGQLPTHRGGVLPAEEWSRAQGDTSSRHSYLVFPASGSVERSGLWVVGASPTVNEWRLPPTREGAPFAISGVL